MPRDDIVDHARLAVARQHRVAARLCRARVRDTVVHDDGRPLAVGSHAGRILSPLGHAIADNQDLIDQHSRAALARDALIGERGHQVRRVAEEPGGHVRLGGEIVQPLVLVDIPPAAGGLADLVHRLAQRDVLYHQVHARVERGHVGGRVDVGPVGGEQVVDDD